MLQTTPMPMGKSGAYSALSAAPPGMDQLSANIQPGRCGDEDEREVHTLFQVPGGPGGLEGRRERSRGKDSPGDGIHPVTLAKWKRQFLDRGPEIFGGKEEARKYEKKISELERMLGQKEVEIALLCNFQNR